MESDDDASYCDSWNAQMQLVVQQPLIVQLAMQTNYNNAQMQMKFLRPR
jgi:hypothetical protein